MSGCIWRIRKRSADVPLDPVRLRDNEVRVGARELLGQGHDLRQCDARAGHHAAPLPANAGCHGVVAHRYLTIFREVNSWRKSEFEIST